MIYMFLAEGFEETEAICPLDMLRRANIEVKTVGIGGINIKGSHGITVVADMADSDFDDFKPDGVILPGGMPGTKNLEASAVVQRVLDIAVDKGVHIAAICAAPMILGKKGILKGREAICYPGYEEYLDGAVLSNKRCVTDGNITTAIGVGAALEFGIELVRVFDSQDTAQKLSRAAIIR